MAVDLTPHPLVRDVAAGLSDLVDLASVGAELISAKSAAIVGSSPAGAVRGELSPLEKAEERLVIGLAGAADLPELVTFAGYVGATIKQQKKEWCVLYLDTRLQTWLLVYTTGIVFRDPVKVDEAPCGIRDVLWVTGDTPVGRGSGSLSLEAQFLAGEFTRAGDYDSGPNGGTLAGATGVFCEARSVGCCTPKSNKPKP